MTHRLARTLLTALTLATTACGSDHSNTRVDTPEPPAAAARSGDDAYRYLQRYVALGLHRTGTDGGQQLVDWLAQELRAQGLTPAIERFEFNHQFVPETASLKLDDGFEPAVFPYWYSGRTDGAGLNAELVDVGGGTAREFGAAAVDGKLALVEVKLQARAIFTDLNGIMQRAKAAGAVGLVAAIQAPGNLIPASNAESEAGLCGLPVLFVGRQDGRRLRQRAGRLARFTLAASLRSGESANVVATIPGRSDETLIVGTPVNGWFTTASERGAGVGTLLTLARHYAERTVQTGTPPDKTLVLVFSGGHEVGFLGLQRYIDRHADVLARTYGYVHLGAAIAGTYYYETPRGEIVDAPIADPARTLYVSENPLLQRLVAIRQLLTGLAPVQSIPPSVNNPGEQRRMYARGVPIVSISGTTLFFHTEADTAETTSAALLEPAVQFYGAVIDDLLAADPAEVRANNAVAAGFAKPLPAPVCAVPAD